MTLTNLKALRLVLAVALFTGWMGYLGYLALNRYHGPIVSHIQAAAAQVAVVAEVGATTDGKPDRTATINEVLTAPAAGLEQGRKLFIANLEVARGFEGPGQYLLLLEGGDVRPFALVQPHTAGTSYRWNDGVDRPVPQPVIYRWSNEIRKQFEALAR